jgi:O-antigen ligase
LVWGAGGAAIVGLIQFSFQFILGLEKTIRLWADFIAHFLGSSFSQAVTKNSSWLVGISGHDFFRSISVFPDPHMFSFYLNLILPWSLILYFSTGKRKLFLILFLLILTADILTFSRGGYLGIIASTAFGLIFLRRKIANLWKTPEYRYKKWGAVVLPALIIIILSTTNPVSQRFFSSFRIEEGSNQGRIENWANSLSVVVHNPLGVGLGNYPLEIKPSADYREPIYSHNLYLDIAAETGIANALIWVILIFSSIFSFLRKSRENYFYLGGALGLISFFVHSFFETALFSTQVLPLLLIIIALGAVNLRKTDEKSV